MRGLALPLAALAALASPVALRAEESQPPVPLSPEAEQTLQCAVWASYFSAAYEGEEEATAIAHALNYFVGRYEGLTGQGIDKALDERLIVATANSIDALTPTCAAKMQDYGLRMLNWAKALQAIASRLPDDEPQHAS